MAPCHGGPESPYPSNGVYVAHGSVISPESNDADQLKGKGRRFLHLKPYGWWFPRITKLHLRVTQRVFIFLGLTRQLPGLK